MRTATLPSTFNNYDFSALAKKEKNSALKIRYLAFSYIQSGKTVLEAAKLVYKSARMIHRWINKLAEFGLDGLKDKHGRGRTLCLPREKDPEFKSMVLRFLIEKNRKKVFGYDIQHLLKKYYNIDCTLPTAYSILSRLQINDKYPKQNIKFKNTFTNINLKC